MFHIRTCLGQRGAFLSLLCGVVLLLSLVLSCCSSSGESPVTQETEQTGSRDSAILPPEGTETAEPQTKEALTAPQVAAQRISRQQIQISWADDGKGQVKEYIVKKRPALDGAGVGEWSTVAAVPSQGSSETLQVVDQLEDPAIRLFEYAVELVPADISLAHQTSDGVLASNLLVCIDPGHYAGANAMEGGYTEGDATLRIGLRLREILKSDYGIDSCMTREGGSITLEGHTDGELDQNFLRLRGAYAGVTGSDLFLSLHTNANEDNANGYETCSQPISINKPILLANTLACSSRAAIAVGNAIGANLAQASYRAGTATQSGFQAVRAGNLSQWTDAYNDSPDLPGTMFARQMGDGRDYYGVLRGAAEVGVPGIIIEHGMHTVPEVRQIAVTGDLLERWASADAYGIAFGFGFLSQPVQP